MAVDNKKIDEHMYENAVVETLRSLPPDKQSVVLDFAKYLASKERSSDSELTLPI